MQMNEYTSNNPDNLCKLKECCATDIAKFRMVGSHSDPLMQDSPTTTGGGYHWWVLSFFADLKIKVFRPCEEIISAKALYF